MANDYFNVIYHYSSFLSLQWIVCSILIVQICLAQWWFAVDDVKAKVFSLRFFSLFLWLFAHHLTSSPLTLAINYFLTAKLYTIVLPFPFKQIEKIKYTVVVVRLSATYTYVCFCFRFTICVYLSLVCPVCNSSILKIIFKNNANHVVKVLIYQWPKPVKTK